MFAVDQADSTDKAPSGPSSWRTHLTKKPGVVKLKRVCFRLMLQRLPVFCAVWAAASAVCMGAVPAQAAQNCGQGAHWVQTGPALGAGYCTANHHHHKKHHHHNHDHYVCALGYHYAGHGRCVRNGEWWTGGRPVEWGPYYEPRNKSGSVSFQGPNGGEVKVRW